MQRLFLLISLVMLVQCDLFTTRPFQPSPAQSRNLNAYPKIGETWAFVLEEALDSVAQGSVSAPNQGFLIRDSLKLTGLSISQVGENRATGLGHSCSLVQRQVSGSGTQSGRKDTVCFENGENGFMAQKVRLGFNESLIPGWEDDLMQAMEDKKLLLPELETQVPWFTNQGAYRTVRRVLGRDTLVFKKELEESFVVSEVVTFGGDTVAQHKYWYGFNGLLAAEQRFSGLDSYSETGENLGEFEFIRRLRRVP